MDAERCRKAPNIGRRAENLWQVPESNSVATPIKVAVDPASFSPNTPSGHGGCRRAALLHNTISLASFPIDLFLLPSPNHSLPYIVQPQCTGGIVMPERHCCFCLDHSCGPNGEALSHAALCRHMALYVGFHVDLDCCPICNELRWRQHLFNRQRKARKQNTCTPFTSRIQPSLALLTLLNCSVRECASCPQWYPCVHGLVYGGSGGTLPSLKQDMRLLRCQMTVSSPIGHVQRVGLFCSCCLIFRHLKVDSKEQYKLLAAIPGPRNDGDGDSSLSTPLCTSSRR